MEKINTSEASPNPELNVSSDEIGPAVVKSAEEGLNRGFSKEMGLMEEKIKSLAQFIDSKKGVDIQILDLRKIHSYLNFFLIASADSILHAKSIVRDIRKNIKEFEIDRIGYLDEQSPDWIVVDCFWLVIHIFTPKTREFFALEKLWGDARKIEWK